MSGGKCSAIKPGTAWWLQSLTAHRARQHPRAMLPLLAESTPATIPELTEALTRGLQAQGLIPRQVVAEGGVFPKIERLRIDLTEARLTRQIRPPQVSGQPGPTVEVAQFELVGTPIYFETTALELRLVAEQVKSRLQMDAGRGSLVLESAATGTASVEIAREALEALLHQIAVEAAGKQGLEVRKTSLSFTQEGPRTVSFRAEVTAKVFVMSATLALTGRLSIDEQMNARISDLVLDGDAMILKLAGGYARPHLDRLEGRVFPLLAFAAGGLKLEDVVLTVGTTLKVQARLGAARLPVT